MLPGPGFQSYAQSSPPNESAGGFDADRSLFSDVELPFRTREHCSTADRLRSDNQLILSDANFRGDSTPELRSYSLIACYHRRSVDETPKLHYMPSRDIRTAVPVVEEGAQDTSGSAQNFSIPCPAQLCHVHAADENSTAIFSAAHESFDNIHGHRSEAYPSFPVNDNHLQYSAPNSELCDHPVVENPDTPHSPVLHCNPCGCFSLLCSRRCFPSKFTQSQYNQGSCWSRFCHAMFPLHCIFPTCTCSQCPRWRRRRIPNESLLILSIIQLLCGFAAIILSSVALTKTVFLYQMATGMWAGFLMLVAGTQGLIAARRPIVCTLVGLLVFCLIVTVAACLLICVSVAGTIEDGFFDGMNSKGGSRHHLVRFTYSFHKLDRPFQISDTSHSFFSSQGLSNTFIPVLSNFTGVGPLRLKIPGKDLAVSIPDGNLRTCQVILHVLLLLIGILESSVSLSTSIICCRYVCSRAGRSRCNRDAYAARTNIVSFNSATANQAAALLQSGDMTQFTGSGNVLLAVSSGSISDSNMNLNPTSENRVLEPLIHHTMAPFLPSSSRPALILTQAGTGAMAWTAARAAATLLNRNKPLYPPDCQLTGNSGSVASEDVSVLSNFTGIRSYFTRNRRRQTRLRRLNRPRLLFTSLSTPVPQNCPHSDRIGFCNDGPILPPGSTLIYVMPSPSQEQPPMIFPPFPPTYSSLQRRPSSPNLPRDLPSAERCLPGQSHQVGSRAERGRPRRSNVRRVLSSIFIQRRLRRRESNSNVRIRPRRGRYRGSRAAASALICASDRLLQPVLIIEDPSTPDFRSADLRGDPPAYCAVDPNLHSPVHKQD
ncbi:unnamed protein product [Calicophoron daubneyi]|uniref:Uncharacterized protein n=1 Tax=Calicophoron daubneyi TaxID=300641 RepID=A0AAV2TUG7_CALDB